MNRAAKLGKKSPPPPPPPPPPASCTSLDSNAESMKKDIWISRNPLKELNSTSCNTASITCGSSLSVEAPRGCLSFFLPNPSSSSFSKIPLYSRPKSHHKTPKSAPPNPRPSMKPILSTTTKHPTDHQQINPQRTKKKTGPPLRLSRWQRGNSCSSRARSPMPHPKRSPALNENEDCFVSGFFTKKTGSEEEPLEKLELEPLQQPGEHPELGLLDNKNNIKGSPTHNFACGFGLHTTTTTTTPPPHGHGKDANEESSVTTNTTATPPVQASISPEIQHYASSMISTTPAACFAAGHVLSRVTDKRKCRPRGILTAAAGEDLDQDPRWFSNNIGDEDDPNSFLGTINRSRLSLLPAPTEASVHWLLSPCEEDQKGNPRYGSPEAEVSTFFDPIPDVQSPSSPSSSGHGFSSSSNCSSSNTSTSARKRAFLIPPIPSWSPLNEACSFSLASSASSSRFKNAHLDSCSPSSSAHDLTSACKAASMSKPKEERESFSCDSSSSQNVICTPQSDSSSGRCVRLSWLKNGLEFDSLMGFVPGAISHRPMNQTAMGDPADVLPLPGFSFQFTHSTTPSKPSSSSHSQIQCTSSETAFEMLSVGSGSLSPSQMRISWREGLVGQIFEMDEFDCCQWLSDEDEVEKDTTNLADYDQFKMSPKSMSEQLGVGEQIKVKPPTTSSSCAESISTEGGGLAASGDSDWTICYKNHLFKE